MKQTPVFVSVLSFILIFGILCTYAKETQKSIADSVLRLHIIANSDEDFDQELKIKVRDRIIRETSGLFRCDSSIEETRQTVADNLDVFKDIAKNEVVQNGYDYSINAELVESNFPTKQYGDACFPAGLYEALKIEIGEGKGKNWWCVMFPPLCFAAVEFDEISKFKLKNSLSKQNYKLVCGSKNNVPVKVKFKFVEMFAPLFNKNQKLKKL